MNRFLGGHRVVSLDRQLVQDGAGAYWAICVSFLDGASEAAVLKRGKIDYKEVLSEREFALFARLRSLRKDIAEREGLPAYALFTNEQLAAMVAQGVRTTGELGGITGVGEARVERYGAAFLEVLRASEGSPAAGAAEGEDA